MPRKPRMYLPDIPSHVIQRGNNRTACFFAEADYRFYLDCLDNARRRYGVSVHAYVLMTNHVHLLLTPGDTEGISLVMQSIGRRYVQYINKTYRRSGTLWEGRHIATSIQAENYLFTCYRYIEMNPVRAQIVHHPGQYPWSSYMHNFCGITNNLITEHPLYLELGSDPESRQQSYMELFSSELNEKTLSELRKAINFSIPLGDDRFRKEIENENGVGDK